MLILRCTLDLFKSSYDASIKDLMPYLFQSWKESLLIFLPKNAKLFFLVTLKTITQSYKLIIRDFWWLLLLSWSLSIVTAWYFWSQILFNGISLFLQISSVFAFFLIIRPSIKRKGYEYYKDYRSFLFYFLIGALVLTGCLIALFKVLLLFALNPLTAHWIVVASFLSITTLFMSPLFSFIIFFVLDSDGGIKNIFLAIIRGIKMVIYNYPFCFILFTLFKMLDFIAWYLILFVGSSYAVLITPIWLLLLVIPLSIWNNFYIKRLHDQFGLYYPEHIKE
jgi:hypothetical protein